MHFSIKIGQRCRRSLAGPVFVIENDDIGTNFGLMGVTFETFVHHGGSKSDQSGSKSDFRVPKVVLSRGKCERSAAEAEPLELKLRELCISLCIHVQHALLPLPRCGGLMCGALPPTLKES